FDLEADQDRHGFAEPRAGNEAELLGGLDRLLIQAEDRIERARHLHVADRAVRQHDALEPDNALHLGTHGFSGVVGTDAAQQARRVNAVAGTIDTAAGAAAA